MTTYVYPGMPKAEQDRLAKAMFDGVDYPADRKYHFNDLDMKKPEAMEAKKKVRAAYMKARKAEIEEDVKALDEARTICGVVFEKGKPVDCSGVDPRFQKKFATLAASGILKAVEQNKNGQQKRE